MNASPAELLNRDCDCVATQVDALRRDLEAPLGASLAQTHPHLFSEAPVFVDAAHVEAMRRLVDAVHRVAGLPGWQATALAEAPAIARIPQATAGVFSGFDFHLSADGPKLIEINTNAGGALLNAAARRHQPPCCEGFDRIVRTPADAATLEGLFTDSFHREWRRARGDAPLRTVAIVDDEPSRQYLHPEFVLMTNLLRRQGIDAWIADARELEYSNGVLVHAGKKIDLVYNRLTDFYLEDATHGALHAAYESGAAVVTPHPRAHALFARKSNLERLTDAPFLHSIGASAEDVDTLLARIPRTRCVNGEPGFWDSRKQWFFKPIDGFGSRGTYRGDKMTRRVFAEVAGGRYVAQEFAPPGERWRTGAQGRTAFKVDVRAYVYDGELQLLAARLYQGQTTNFRTAGGGFAPVFVVDSRGEPPPAPSPAAAATSG